MTRSMVSPDTIWLKKTELTDSGLFLILRVRSNIKQVTVEGMDGESHLEYEYDETETRYPVPEGVTSVADIQNLISTDTPVVISKAGREKAWQEIHAKPIEDLRKVAIIKAL